MTDASAIDVPEESRAFRYDGKVPPGETICTITDHFGEQEHAVEAPFTGLLVGVLENPVALPGHPLCHLAAVDDETCAKIEAEIERGESDGYRVNGGRWRAGDDD